MIYKKRRAAEQEKEKAMKRSRQPMSHKLRQLNSEHLFSLSLPSPHSRSLKHSYIIGDFWNQAGVWYESPNVKIMAISFATTRIGKNEEIIGSAKNRLMRIETCGSLAHSHPWIFVLTYPEIGQEIRQDFHQSRASSYISYSQESLKRLFYFRYFDEAWKVTRFTEFLWIEWLGGSLGNEIIKVVSRVIAMNFLLCWVCLGF